MKRYIFPDPLDATCRLQPDSMTSPIVGVPDTHPANGAPCQSFNLPSTVPNRNGATLTIEKAGFASVVLHGILDTVTAGGGGFECDVFKLQGRSPYRVTIQQPITFDSNGGFGSFDVQTTPGNKWMADEDVNAEDWVEVAMGQVDGSGTKNFRVLSAAQQPNVPLPRTGYIEIYESNNAVLTTMTRVQILQK